MDETNEIGFKGTNMDPRWLLDEVELKVCIL